MRKFNLLFLILTFLIITISINGQSNIPEKWITKFEKSNFLSTEDYDETMAYFTQLAEYSDYCELKTVGQTPQGRDFNILIVDKDMNFNPVEVSKREKPVLMIENGIHSGEIEGKDACMLMLREMLVTKEKEYLLDNTTYVIIPIFNIDGHERTSPYNRINQDGPIEMGWRTTAQNLNLNRDFTKADAPEMKILLQLFSKWLPDFFIDTHTTDGADYQYVITYGIEKWQNMPSLTADWVKNEYVPFVENYVDSSGFLISPYVGYVKRDFRNGLRDWASSPRYSHGYTAVQNRPGLLIETHMLKPYKERVYSTKALIEATADLLNKNPKEIVELNQLADNEAIEKYFNRKEDYPLTVDIIDSADTKRFYKGYKFVDEFIDLAGGKVRKYLPEKLDVEVDYYNIGKISSLVKIPTAYIIPKEYSAFVDILKLHGVKVDVISKSEPVHVEKIKFKNVKLPAGSYEGRQMPKFEYDVLEEQVTTKVGDYYVPTNQRTIGIIAHLLEPKAPDSFVKWGVMNEIFEPKEYFEMYSMLPIAQEMYDTNPKLKKEFDAKVNEDAEFRDNPRARLNFFYERSEYFDKKLNVYPILRVVN